MAIAHNCGYPDESYCEDHPKYAYYKRPTYPCLYCWRIWDDQQKKRIRELEQEVKELRAATSIRIDALRGLTRELVRGVREEET